MFQPWDNASSEYIPTLSSTMNSANGSISAGLILMKLSPHSPKVEVRGRQKSKNSLSFLSAISAETRLTLTEMASLKRGGVSASRCSGASVPLSLLMFAKSGCSSISRISRVRVSNLLPVRRPVAPLVLVPAPPFSSLTPVNPVDCKSLIIRRRAKPAIYQANSRRFSNGRTSNTPVH